MRTSTVLLYLGSLICAFACFKQLSYFASYFTEATNPYREEYLGGIFMIGTLSAIVWIPVFGVAFLRQLRRSGRLIHAIVPLFTGGLVGLFSMAAALLSFAA